MPHHSANSNTSKRGPAWAKTCAASHITLDRTLSVSAGLSCWAVRR
jgi:hypothetical protein